MYKPVLVCVFRVYYRSRGSWRRIWILCWSAVTTSSGDLWPLLCVRADVVGVSTTRHGERLTEKLQCSLRITGARSVVQHSETGCSKWSLLLWDALVKVHITTNRLQQIFQSNADCIKVNLKGNLDLGRYVPPVMVVITVRRQKWLFFFFLASSSVSPTTQDYSPNDFHRLKHIVLSSSSGATDNHDAKPSCVEAFWTQHTVWTSSSSSSSKHIVETVTDVCFAFSLNTPTVIIKSRNTSEFLGLEFWLKCELQVQHEHLTEFLNLTLSLRTPQCFL